MYSKISLKNFRSYKEHATNISPGINIVIGPNASGKTNLLESVYIISQGKSFKKSLKTVVMHNEEWARIDVQGEENKTLKLKYENELLNKAFILGEKTYKRLPYSKKQPTTLFEPNHLRLLHGSPERRRDFLDDLIGQVDGVYIKEKSSYTRALKQRNFLLKQGGQVEDQIFIWNLKLAQHGAYLIKKRTELSEHINERLENKYSQLTDKKHSVKVQYTNIITSNIQEKLLAKLSRNTANDINKGYTSVGPHRDDLVITINDQDAASSASRGETRTLVLGLKMIEMEIFESLLSRKPIILLDDVFSELDGRRRKLLTKTLNDYQTIITTTDADIISKDFLGKSNIIPTKTN